MQWKYKVIALSDDATASAKHLTRLGANGWELITVHGDDKGLVAYLKMEAQEAAAVTL